MSDDSEGQSVSELFGHMTRLNHSYVCVARGGELTRMLSSKLTDKGWKFIQIERTTWGNFIS